MSILRKTLEEYQVKILFSNMLFNSNGYKKFFRIKDISRTKYRLEFLFPYSLKRLFYTTSCLFMCG